MASTVFVNGVTPVDADWLNDVNNAVYTRSQGSVIATSGQTIFTVPFTYVVGDKRLAVYINGIKQLITSSYAETNSTTVTFTEGLNVGAIVEFVY